MTAVHALVQELAFYEKAPHEVVTTPQQYVQDFRDKCFDCLVADMGGQIVGLAFYFMAYSTWKGKMLYLEDLVVQEAYRGKGIGRRLFETVLEEGRRCRCRLVKWQVLGWNEPAIAFYRTFGAVLETEWWNGKIVL